MSLTKSQKAGVLEFLVHTEEPRWFAEASRVSVPFVFFLHRSLWRTVLETANKMTEWDQISDAVT